MFLMFCDWDFVVQRYAQPKSSLLAWWARPTSLVVIEIGAGSAIPGSGDFGSDI
jgi:hypothetical protein